MLVCDTCALLSWTLGFGPAMDADLRARLGREPTAVSSISACEIAWKQRLGKLDLGLDAGEFWRRVERLPLTVVPVDAPQWLASVALDWDHRDPADRLIVALAARDDATLVTCDRRMRGYYAGCAW